jgi:tripartite-type tricarboxylate transporter receptor subunit TctC
MKPSRRAVFGFASGGLLWLAAPRLVNAQAWSGRAVRIVVGLAPGGGMDAVARILAGRLSEVWGHQVIVENRSGAGGNLAYEAVAHAVPDGTTLLVAARAPALNRFLYAKLSYDPDADFAPVTLIGQFPYLLVVPASSPEKSLQEFIARAKANPGKMTFASPGVGGAPHLAGELLNRMVGISMTHIPYRGVAAGALGDLLAGRVDAMFNALASLLPPVTAGQVRALGVTSAQRFTTIPDIPTFIESGVPGFDVSSGYGLYAPVATPQDVVGKINGAVVAALAEPAVKAKFEPLGTALVGSTSDALAARDRADAARWGPLIKELKIAGG